MQSIAVSKNQLATQTLAMDILGRSVGDRLPTSRDYQSELQMGSGTITKSLRALEDVGAVALRARGHQGTFIVGKHVGRLWSIAGLGPVTGSFPPMGVPQSDGLVAALRAEFDAHDVPLHAVHERGAESRINHVVRAEADVGLISGSAHERLASGGEELRAWDLGPFTYYSEGSLEVLLRPGLEDVDAVRRVGVSRDSLDHVRFTEAEFGLDVEYVDLEYTRLALATASGEIDAALWHQTPLALPLEMAGITVRRLASPASLELAQACSNAVLIARSDKPQLIALVDRLDLEKIASAPRQPRARNASVLF